MSIVEVIYPIPSGCNFFTGVNSDYAYLQAAPGVDFRAKNIEGNWIFQQGDSLRILTGGIVLPENFTWYRNSILANNFEGLRINPIGSTSNEAYTNPCFAEGRIAVPLERHEALLDSFFDCSKSFQVAHPAISIDSEAFHFELKLDNTLLISQMGMNPAWIGKDFLVVPFIRIEHDFPLTSAI